MLNYSFVQRFQSGVSNSPFGQFNNINNLIGDFISSPPPRSPEKLRCHTGESEHKQTVKK